jgi:hypothetical protein
MSAQWEHLQFFDGADTSSWNSIQFEFENDTSTLWQVGSPQKSEFNEALSPPNALLTDTLNPYPVESFESVGFKVPLDEWGGNWGILALRWSQRLDMRNGQAIGMVEFSVDSTTWQSAFDNPYVYSFYGYAENNVYLTDTLKGFIGSDNEWRDIWLCYDLGYLEWNDTLSIRYTFRSDSTGNDFFPHHDGWMMDNFQAGITSIHTLAEEVQEKYMKVYPTITDGRVQIEGQKLMESHFIDEMEVYNMKGEVVQRYGRHPVKTFIDLSGLSDGNYVLRIATNKKEEHFQIVLRK